MFPKGDLDYDIVPHFLTEYSFVPLHQLNCASVKSFILKYYKVIIKI